MRNNFQFSIFNFQKEQTVSLNPFANCKLQIENCRAADAPQRGFTLIELMVSVALFIVIMLVSVGALLALVDANKKARALESVINNLNISLDGMVRAMRMGSLYNCGSSAIPDSNGGDCVNGGTTFSFAPYGSDPSNQTQRWVYTFSNGQIFRSKQGGTNLVAITAPEVSISTQALDKPFYVVGTVPRDIVQPKVVLVVKGTAGPSPKTQSAFYIQATAVQRSLDL